MLTDEQLSGLIGSSDLQPQIMGSVLAVAKIVENEDPDTPNHVNRLKWAASAMGSPTAAALKMRGSVLARYQATLGPPPYTLTDEQIRAAITESVDTFADGT